MVCSPDVPGGLAADPGAQEARVVIKNKVKGQLQRDVSSVSIKRKMRLRDE